MNTNLHLLIFEPGGNGHQFQFVGNMLQGLSSLASKITVCTRKSYLQSSGFEQHLKPLLGEKICVDTMDDAKAGAGILGSARALAKNLCNKAASIRPDRVYIPGGDGILQALAIRKLAFKKNFAKNVSVESLLLNGKVAYSHLSFKDRLQSILSSLLARSFQGTSLFHLDPFAAETINHGRKNRPCIVAMPEPVEAPMPISREAARRRFGLSENNTIIGMAGVIDERKGADLFLSAVELLHLEQNKTILLVGAVSENIKKLIDSRFSDLLNRGQMVIVDRFVSNEELHAAIIAMDIVAAPYRTSTVSSGIVTRSILYERMIVGADSGWLGKMIDRFQLGFACEVSNAREFANALDSSTKSLQNFRYSEAAKQLSGFHSAENFQCHWAMGARKQLGLPEDKRLLTWRW